MRSRESLLSDIEGSAVEVLVVGGGINGVGVYRDLAAQGIPALLVERTDFGAGTTAAPSRLAHGGLRYLETGEFALVRESVEERNRMMVNAPHLLIPLRCWVPLADVFGGLATAPLRGLKLVRTPGRKGALVVKLGLVLYDLFARKNRVMPRHRMVGRREVHAEIPSLAPSVIAVAEYFDARILHPERLTMELVADAERDCPAARALPYVELEGREGDRVVLRDTVGGRRIAVRPRVVVNAAGAWIDGVDQRLGIPGRLVGGTRGSHLLVRAPRFARELADRMIYFETFDRRACLAYAFDEDHVFIGTTDLRTDDPDAAACTPEEVDYIFRVVDEIAPGAKLNKRDVVFHVTGVRPLPRTEGVVAGAISRDHRIVPFAAKDDRPFDVLTLVGGKWTTYRACAAQIVDALLPRLGAARKTGTEDLPIGGGRDFPGGSDPVGAIAGEIAGRYRLPLPRARLLARRYGTRAAEVAAALPADDAPLAAAPAYSRGEIAFLVRDERVTRLDDIVLRRTLIGFENRATRAALAELAGIAAGVLGWSEARTAEEIARAEALLHDRHGVAFPRRAESQAAE